MGEKGNSITGGVAAGAGSIIERITTTATETVTGVGSDFIETVKDKSVGAVAESTIASAKQRLTRSHPEGGEDAGESVGEVAPPADDDRS